MLRMRKLLFQVENNIDDIVRETAPLGQDLLNVIIKQHPADISWILGKLDKRNQVALFKKLPKKLQNKVFEDLSEKSKAYLLVKLEVDQATSILKNIHTESLTEFFEFLSDEDLKKYLKFLQKNQRAEIISRLNFKSDSAGRIMNSEILTLQKDFTIKKSITIIQKLGEKREVLRKIFVTDKDEKLLGYINLEDLVLNDPNTQIKNILQDTVLTIDVNLDKELAAKDILHYKLTVAPVVDSQKHFLGVITAEDIVGVVEEEADEDVYKMSGVTPVEHGYFETSIWTFILQRTPWLVGLLLLQSISSFIMTGYKEIVDKYFIVSMFLTMLIGTGGNAGNQSSAIIIRGLATGQISKKMGIRVLIKEFGVSVLISLILSVVSFFRVYFFRQNFLDAFTVSLALFLIIITSMFFGTLLPLLLERFNLDPAHSAAPFLATLMDILGVLIYCSVVSRILG